MAIEDHFGDFREKMIADLDNGQTALYDLMKGAATVGICINITAKRI